MSKVHIGCLRVVLKSKNCFIFNIQVSHRTEGHTEGWKDRWTDSEIISTIGVRITTDIQFKQLELVSWMGPDMATRIHHEELIFRLTNTDSVTGYTVHMYRKLGHKYYSFFGVRNR